MRALLIAAALSAPLSVQVRTVQPRSVGWYQTHPDVLRQTLLVCHSNSAYASTPDCDNAERAAAGLMGRDAARSTRPGAPAMTDPAYWSANPFARAGVLAQCRRRAPGDELVFPYCRAAAESALHDLAR